MMTPTSPPRRTGRLAVLVCLALFLGVAPGHASHGPALTEAQKKKLDENWRLCLLKKKGPYTANMCVCQDGTKEMVRKDETGKLVIPCGGRWRFCEAFRSDWGKALAEEGVYVGNLFERDLYEWDSIGDYDDLVRGYILEKFFIETHPEHKLAVLRSYGGLAGAEYEAEAMPRFFERYLALPGFDEPLWVLPSVVILESVPSEKSGVLVTADVHTGDESRMLVATSEGVGGAVDGTPAETLLWSPDGVELLTMFKSPWRRLLNADGGSELVASTRSEYVLTDEELDELIRTAKVIRDRLEPSRDSSGRARAWDIEYGFSDGKLWLFQTRPFIGNEQLRNVPALAIYEVSSKGGPKRLSLEEKIP